MARLHSPSHAHPRAHPSVLEGARRTSFPHRADMVGRGRDRGAVPGDLGFQLRAGRRSGARSHARGGRGRAAAGARRGRDGHVPRGDVLPRGHDRSPRRALHDRTHVVLGPGDGPDGGPQRPPGRCAGGAPGARRRTLVARRGIARAVRQRSDRVGAAAEHRAGDVLRRAQAVARRPRRRGRRSRRSPRWCNWRVSATWTTSPRSPTRGAGDWRRRSCPERSSWLAKPAPST